LKDCATVFTARDTVENEAYSSGETYFIGADEMPGCALEQLAQDIFRFHAKGLSFDASKSGAEWWTLVLDDAANSNVAPHWDKDYGLEEYYVNVFPHIGTVTYLSGAGGPTCVMEKTAPPRPDESIVGPAHCAYVSRPHFGKHISFDGRFLHFASTDALVMFDGAQNAPIGTKEPEEASSRTSKKEEARITFLVNIWFNHLPLDCERLPVPIQRQLDNKDMFAWRNEVNEVEPSKIDCVNASQIALSQDYDLFDGYKVKFHIPRSATSDSVIIRYSNDIAPLVYEVST
jgi:hypothetical protein